MLPPPVSSACSVGGAPTAGSLLTPKVTGKKLTHTRGRAFLALICCRTRGEENPRVRPQRQEQRPRRLGWLSPPSLVAAALVLALSPPHPVATPESLGQTGGVSQKGAALFQKACIGCHDAGGNILQPGATLFMTDLERNGVATEEEIYKITYSGKGRMPGFGEKCTPRGQCTFGPRLQDEEIKQLAEFVKSQADGGWPKLEVYRD